METSVPLPNGWQELERYIARLARAFLEDPHASRYGLQGAKQDGIDVLARDRRPGKHGQLWAFQAKHYPRKKLQKSHLDKMSRLLETFPQRREIHTFIIVTTADVTTAVQNRARELEKDLQVDFQVWSWEHFSELLIKHCGTGPWLAQKERSQLRQRYCLYVRRELQEAWPLQPLRLPPDCHIRLEEVLIPRVLRLAEWAGTRRGTGASGAPDGSEPGGGSPSRYEGRLVEWLSPRQTSKPLVLVLAPMGAGKTVALLEAATEFATTAQDREDAPLPLRIKAVSLTQGRIDEQVRRMPFNGTEQLWKDPMSSWSLLVDGLDEVDERLQPQVLQEVASLLERENVVAIALACRTSHLHPRLLPEATRVEVPQWSTQDWKDFLIRWRDALHGQMSSIGISASTVDPSLLSNPLCSTLFALFSPEEDRAPPGRIRLFRRLVDSLFRRWTEGRGDKTWEQLKEAFEQMALEGLARGGRPLPRQVLESALLHAHDDSQVELTLQAADQHFGLLRRLPDGSWEFPLRAIAEYLAAGALLRKSDEEIIKTAGQPWAGEVARMALERCWEFKKERTLSLLKHLVTSHAKESEEFILRWCLVAAQVAQDLGAESYPIAQALAQRLRELLTDEASPWRRSRVAEDVRNFASSGGPVWTALWQELRPLLVVPGTRAAWLDRYGDGDMRFWINRLHEQDLRVRVVAAKHLKPWKDQPEVQSLLSWQLLDTGWGVEPHDRPALAAAEVLRDVPHSDELRETLRGLLQTDDPHTAGAAAVALHPGEAETETLLLALKSLFKAGGIPSPALYRALDAHRNSPDGREWLERNWPHVLEPNFEPDWFPPPFTERMDSYASSEPPSLPVRGIVLWSILPALLRPEVREILGSFSLEDHDMARALCSVADQAPELIIKMLEEKLRYVPADAQVELARAALVRPEIGDALVTRWRKGLDAGIPGLFPGIALEALAAKGDPDALQVYADWLPSFIASNIPAGWAPSSLAMQQPPVRNAAHVAAKNAWHSAIQGELGIAPLSGILRDLWPSWREDTEITEGLLAWSREDDTERFNASLRAWMQGEFPGNVRQSLSARIQQQERWPRERPFFMYYELPLWLEAAARAGILAEIAPLLHNLLDAPKIAPVIIYQACSYLVRLNPEEGGYWAKRAASVWPMDWENREHISPEDVELLLRAAPEVWAKRCLELVGENEFMMALPFLRMLRRIWNWLPHSQLRDELIRATRALVSYSLPWTSTDILGPAARLGDAAQELLFFMREPVKLGPN